MTNKNKFGDCLSELLAIRGWSAARLAKILNLDSSNVRRWIRGERTPSLNSDYSEQIVHALCSSMDKDYKKANRDAFEKVIRQMGMGLSLEKEMSIDEMLHRVLRESQVYSLTLNYEMRTNHKSTDRQNQVKNLMTSPSHLASNIQEDPLKTQFELNPFGRATIPKVIKGRELILNAAISMLTEALLHNNALNSGEVVLTFQSEKDYFSDFPDLQVHWNEMIIHALSEGWNIKHLCKLNKNVERSVKMVERIIEWANHLGTYSLYYFDKYGITNPPYEIILVKGKGALLCYATENHNEIDMALYLDEVEAVKVIENYTNQMFLNLEPVVKNLTTEEFFEWSTFKDRQPGNHSMYYHDISFLTVPYNIMEKYLKISIPDDNERRVHLTRVADCLHSFNRDIKQYRMRHIYPMKVIEDLVQTGSYKNPYLQPTYDDVITNLQNIIWLLKTHERFEIALLSEEPIYPMNYTVLDLKADHSVLMSVMPKKGHTHFALFVINEGSIVRAFQEYYDNLWNQVSPMNRDKSFVISWFESLLIHAVKFAKNVHD